MWVRDGNRQPHEKPKSDRKSTRLNSSHGYISYAVFCLKKKKQMTITTSQRCHHLLPFQSTSPRNRLLSAYSPPTTSICKGVTHNFTVFYPHRVHADTTT